MKKILLSVAVAGLILLGSDIMAQQGFGTNTPDKSAAVDIVSTKRGLLIPRIDIPLLTAANPVQNPATSLFVYNTNVGTGEGFYYWDGTKWVKFVSSATEKTTSVVEGTTTNVSSAASAGNPNNTEYKVEVDQAALDLAQIGGTLNPTQIKEGTSGQVLVTKETALGSGVFEPTWVNPEEFVKDVVNARNGLTYVPSTGAGVDNIIKLGGALDAGVTTIVTDGATSQLAISNLQDVSGSFDAANQPIVTLGANGILQTVTPKKLIEDAIDKGNLTAKGLSTVGGIITLNSGSTPIANSILKDIELGIAAKSIGADKLTSGSAVDGTIATADGSGGVTYESAATALGQTLSTDSKILVGADATSATTNSLANATLVPTYLKIAAGAITNTELANDAVTTEKIADNAVETSDIKNGAVTSDKILDNTIKPADIEKPGANNQVMVTDASGNVTWIDQSTLGNKDSFTGTAPISVTPSAGTNATGGKDYTIAVATANGTTLGVVKEAATPSVNINAAGELSVNTANVTLAGDVTGSVSATVIKDDAVTALKINADVAGTGLRQNTTTGALELNYATVAKDVSTTSAAIVLTNNTGAALTPMTIDFDQTKIALNANQINGGTAGQVMVVGAGNKGSWVDASTLGNTVTADNGLTKDVNNIQLGGPLTEATVITNTSNTLEIATDATGTLAISGLSNVAPDQANKNKAVVVEGTGVVRTVDKVLFGTNPDVADNDGYSFHTPEVVLNIRIPATGDVNITFPSAASAEGQVINVKVANEDEDDHTGYLNILTTYGSMPFQGWIVKSDGAQWLIVGRN